jgi:hypothetical protein
MKSFKRGETMAREKTGDLDQDLVGEFRHELEGEDSRPRDTEARTRLGHPFRASGKMHGGIPISEES